jgi:hypothetical protein
VDKKSLEWHVLNYCKVCLACRKKLKVHGYRRSIKGQKDIVYASCINRSCELYGIEVPPHTHGKADYVLVKENTG